MREFVRNVILVISLVFDFNFMLNMSEEKEGSLKCSKAGEHLVLRRGFFD